MDDATFLSGQLLIAMPGIGDPRFERALVLVCAHDETHAMGIAVNRPVEGLTVPDLLRRLDVKAQIEIPPDLVLIGGPVQRERGFVVHTDDYSAGDHSIELGGGVALTPTRDALEAMGTQDHPRRALLALGYAGWGAGQLESEMAQNAWLSGPADLDIVFKTPAELRWQRAAARLSATPTRRWHRRISRCA